MRWARLGWRLRLDVETSRSRSDCGRHRRRNRRGCLAAADLDSDQGFVHPPIESFHYIVGLRGGG